MPGREKCLPVVLSKVTKSQEDIILSCIPALSFGSVGSG